MQGESQNWCRPNPSLIRHPTPAEGCTLEGLDVLGTVNLCPSPGLSVTPSAELGLLQWASLGEAWRCLEEPRTFEGEELGAFAAFMPFAVERASSKGTTLKTLASS